MTGARLNEQRLRAENYMKKNLFVEVQGRTGSYVFLFKGDAGQIDKWRADGLTVGVIEGSVPEWVVSLGLAQPWLWVQKLWGLARLW
jgi:hypothetical protein